jgi:hypothetical protein
MIHEIAQRGLTREEVRSVRRMNQADEDYKKPLKPFKFRYKNPDSTVRVEVQFEKAEVDKSEIIQVLRKILSELEA